MKAFKNIVVVSVLMVAGIASLPAMAGSEYNGGLIESHVGGMATSNSSVSVSGGGYGYAYNNSYGNGISYSYVGPDGKARTYNSTTQSSHGSSYGRGLNQFSRVAATQNGAGIANADSNVGFKHNFNWDY